MESQRNNNMFEVWRGSSLMIDSNLNSALGIPLDWTWLIDVNSYSDWQIETAKQYSKVVQSHHHATTPMGTHALKPPLHLGSFKWEVAPLFFNLNSHVIHQAAQLRLLLRRQGLTQPKSGRELCFTLLPWDGDSMALMGFDRFKWYPPTIWILQIYIYIYIYLFIKLYTYIVCMYIYICMHACMYVCLYVCIQIHRRYIMQILNIQTRNA